MTEKISHSERSEESSLKNSTFGVLFSINKAHLNQCLIIPRLRISLNFVDDRRQFHAVQLYGMPAAAKESSTV